jgi:glutamyl-tRNA synthetase
LTQLAAIGLGPPAVLGLLAVSLGLARPDEPVAITDLLDRFDPAILPREPWVVEAAEPLPAAGPGDKVAR